MNTEVLEETTQEVMETHITRVAEISLLKSGIIRCQLNDKTCITDDDMLELMDVFDDMTSGVCRPILVVTGKQNSLSREALELNGMRLRGPRGSARAVVVNDELTRVTVNIYFRLHPPAAHTMFFSKEENALSWLSANFVESPMVA